MTEPEDVEQDLPPSKSSRKRAALAMQKMGERLTLMRPEEVAGLPLTEAMQDAITEARRLTSHGARGRQFQFIGKLMRDIDMDALEAALAAQEDAHKARARIRR
ncbi:MAG: ribosome biogenesis factor YjgA [Pseudomonadota bacterium]